MRPVTPSSNRLASYRPLPFLRAVFQSLATAIFTDAEPGEHLRGSHKKSTPTDPAATSLPFVHDHSRRQGAFGGDFDGREKFGRSVIIFLGKSE